MIREYAPIALIPSAWILTFATMIYPGLDTYWIQHMHYFMILFLTGFTVLSWKQMGKDAVLDIWRKVILTGVFFTVLGALSFNLTQYSSILGFLSLSYWFIAPGVALYYSSNFMDKYSNIYRKLAGETAVGYLLLLLGLYSEVISLQMISLIGIAVIQTLSIVKASKLDS